MSDCLLYSLYSLTILGSPRSLFLLMTDASLNIIGITYVKNNYSIEENAKNGVFEKIEEKVLALNKVKFNGS